MTVIKQLNKRRVVITGLGTVTSIGFGWKEFWKNLLAGKSGITKITSFDTSDYPRHLAGEIKDFDPEKFMTKRRVEAIGRSSQMAIAASKMALKDARFKIKDVYKSEMVVSIGTTTGEIGIIEDFNDSIYKKSKKQFNYNKIYAFPAGSISANVAVDLGIAGSNVVFGNACAAGNYALGFGFDKIRSGEADFALVGGADGFSRIVFTGFSRMFAIAPEKCQPFDKNRRGMIPAEGAGMLFLETYESAKRRGAKIYAEVLGYGLSCDAKHMTNPSSKGIAKVIKKAIDVSKVNPFQIDYISAHGTGTPENDRAECAAFKSVLGSKAKKIPTSSIKSMLGHTMGAASALESIVCSLAIYNREIPPTINYNESDPECDIDCVPNVYRKAAVDVALNNSSAFGGNNCCVAFKKV